MDTLLHDAGKRKRNSEQQQAHRIGPFGWNPNAGAPSRVDHCFSPERKAVRVRRDSGRTYSAMHPCGSWACPKCRGWKAARIVEWCFGLPDSNDPQKVRRALRTWGQVPVGVFPDPVWFTMTHQDAIGRLGKRRDRANDGAGANTLLVLRDGDWLAMFSDSDLSGTKADRKPPRVGRWLQQLEAEEMLRKVLELGVMVKEHGGAVFWTGSWRPTDPPVESFDLGGEPYEEATEDAFPIAAEMAERLYGARPQWGAPLPEEVPIGEPSSRDGNRQGWGWCRLMEEALAQVAALKATGRRIPDQGTVASTGSKSKNKREAVKR